MNTFVFSYCVSIFVQFVAFVIQLYGTMLIVPRSLTLLKSALYVEFYVSIVEFIVYLWIGNSLSNYEVIMSKRYLDWFLTTNGLIISLTLLFIFFKQREEFMKEQKNKKALTYTPNNNIKHIAENNKHELKEMFLSNNLMLICGLLGEKQILPKIYSFSLGFLFFIYYFRILYESFAKHSHSGKILFYIITFIWSLYGFFHLLPTVSKNIGYNILDLLSKNIFGVFMVYLLLYPEAFFFLPR